MHCQPPPTRRRFAPPKKESRVAMLYARYVGINGSLFDFKVLGLQLMTVLLQVGGDMRALCVCVLTFLCVYELAGLIRLRPPLSSSGPRALPTLR